MAEIIARKIKKLLCYIQNIPQYLHTIHSEGEGKCDDKKDLTSSLENIVVTLKRDISGIFRHKECPIECPLTKNGVYHSCCLLPGLAYKLKVLEAKIRIILACYKDDRGQDPNKCWENYRKEIMSLLECVRRDLFKEFLKDLTVEFSKLNKKEKQILSTFEMLNIVDREMNNISCLTTTAEVRRSVPYKSNSFPLIGRCTDSMREGFPAKDPEWSEGTPEGAAKSHPRKRKKQTTVRLSSGCDTESRADGDPRNTGMGRYEGDTLGAYRVEIDWTGKAVPDDKRTELLVEWCPPSGNVYRCSCLRWLGVGTKKANENVLVAPTSSLEDVEGDARARNYESVLMAEIRDAVKNSIIEGEIDIRRVRDEDIQENIEEPIYTQEPKPIEEAKPVVEPRYIEEPRSNEEPKYTYEPKAIEEPKPVVKPRHIEEPKTIEKPKSMEEPRSIEQMNPIVEPRNIEELRTINDPKYTEELRVINWPKYVEEPRTIKEPNPAVESRIIKQSKRAEEMRYLEEPVRGEDLQPVEVPNSDELFLLKWCRKDFKLIDPADGRVVVDFEDSLEEDGTVLRHKLLCVTEVRQERPAGSDGVSWYDCAKMICDSLITE